MSFTTWESFVYCHTSICQDDCISSFYRERTRETFTFGNLPDLFLSITSFGWFLFISSVYRKTVIIAIVVFCLIYAVLWMNKEEKVVETPKFGASLFEVRMALGTLSWWLVCEVRVVLRWRTMKFGLILVVGVKSHCKYFQNKVYKRYSFLPTSFFLTLHQKERKKIL